MIRPKIVVLLAILLAAFWLRIWHLNVDSIWHDEGWSIQAIRGPFTTPDDKTPFGYYAAMNLLWRGAGETPFALRYGSALLGVLLVAAAARLAGRWYGTAAGWAAGIMTAVVPLLWAYSQEVRAYIVMPLAAVALLGILYGLLRAGKKLPNRMLFLALGIEIAALYTHNLAVPLVAWTAGAAGAVLVIRRDWGSLKIWIAGQISVGLLYVPWVLTQAPSGTPLNTPPVLGLELARDVWYGYFLPGLPQLRAVGSDWLLNGLAAVLLLIVLARIFSNFRRQNLRDWLLLTHVIGLPILTTILLLTAHIDFHPRYTIAALPGTLVLLAGGLTTPIQQPYVRRLWIAGITALCVWVSLQSIQAITNTPAYGHDDVRGLADYYATLPDDTAILLPFQTEPALQRYYAEKVGIRARFVNVPLYSDEATALQAINELVEQGIKQVEFLTWYQLPADERGMYPCLLTAASSSVGDQHIFVGLMTERYVLNQTVNLKPIPASPDYADFQLRDLAYASSTAGVCVRSAWTNPPDGASIAARILNPLEAEIARSDAAIMSANPFQPNAAAYNRMALPDGAPMTDYGLAMTVYDSAHPNGYDLIGAAGNPVGKTFSIIQAVQAEGTSYPDAVEQAQLISVDDRQITTGIPLNLTLLLPGGQGQVAVRLTGVGREQMQSVMVSDTPTLVWLRFTMPPGEGGEATLMVDDVPIATYTVTDPPRLFDPPAFEQDVHAPFVGVGTLEGVTVAQEGDQLAVTLVWQGGGASDVPYTVFVQLIGADGQVIAQSDQMPAQNTRPTTGWVSGEYIEDKHWLDAPDGIPSDAQLIVGLYDAAQPNFPRVLTTYNADFVKIRG